MVCINLKSAMVCINLKSAKYQLAKRHWNLHLIPLYISVQDRCILMMAIWWWVIWCFWPIIFRSTQKFTSSESLWWCCGASETSTLWRKICHIQFPLWFQNIANSVRHIHFEISGGFNPAQNVNAVGPKYAPRSLDCVCVCGVKQISQAYSKDCNLKFHSWDGFWSIWSYLACT